MRAAKSSSCFHGYQFEAAAAAAAADFHSQFAYVAADGAGLLEFVQML